MTGQRAQLQAATGAVIFSRDWLAVATALASESQMVATSRGWPVEPWCRQEALPGALALAAGRPEAEASAMSPALDV